MAKLTAGGGRWTADKDGKYTTTSGLKVSEKKMTELLERTYGPVRRHS